MNFGGEEEEKEKEQKVDFGIAPPPPPAFMSGDGELWQNSCKNHVRKINYKIPLTFMTVGIMRRKEENTEVLLYAHV